MSTETLKISLAQQILSISDNSILEKVRNLLNSEVVVGYEADGSPITQSQFIEDMEDVDRQIKAGTLKTSTTEEVRQQIFGNRR